MNTKPWIQMLAAFLLLSQVAIAGDPIDDYDSENMDDLRLHQAQFVKDHNSYEHGDTLTSRLDRFQVVELDLWAKGVGNWWVSHGIPNQVRPYLNNNCGGSHFFKDCLRDIEDWHDDNDDHPLLIVNVDFKDDWLAGSDQKDFDDAIHQRFDNSELYRPIDLRGDHDDIRHAARAGNWARLGDLRGKLMFIITGGALARHNAHQSSYLKNRIMGSADYKGVAFVCPVINDWDDVWFKYNASDNHTENSGDLDQINKEKRHVACFTTSWDNRKKFDAVDVAANGVLLHIYNVPNRAGDFNDAVEDRRASIIAPESHPSASHVYQGARDTSSLGSVEFYDENDGKGAIVAKFAFSDGLNRTKDCTDSSACENDEARSMKFFGVTAGMRVHVYDSPSGSHDDDHTKIDILQDGSYTIDTFEKDRTHSGYEVDYHRDNGLDGKISRIKLVDTR